MGKKALVSNFNSQKDSYYSHETIQLEESHIELTIEKAEQLLDYQQAYEYACSVVTKSACNTNKLKTKLLNKTSEENTFTIIKNLKDKQLLDDYKLCKDSAFMWVQKKPISFIQLVNKFQNYGFDRDTISNALTTIEHMYLNDEIFFIGSIPLNQIKELIAKCTLFLNLWEALALSAAIILKRNNIHITNTVIKHRLSLRGFKNNGKVIVVLEHAESSETE